jgi:hypothetical protein
MQSPDDVGLDNPMYAALTSVQSRFAQVCGQAVCYAADVAPFLALPREPSARDWADAAYLVGPFLERRLRPIVVRGSPRDSSARSRVAFIVATSVHS